MSATPPAPPTPPPAAGEAKPPAKSRAWLYALIGCGGCVFLFAVSAIAIVLIGSYTAKKKLGTFASASLSIKVAAQEATLEAYLEDDKLRSDRVKKLWDDLGKATASGELQAPEIDDLQAEIDDATRDGNLSPEEADALIAKAEKLEK